MAQTNPRRRYPSLWQDNEGHKLTAERKAETVDDLIQRFSSKPPPRSLWSLIHGSLVVGQEFALTCLLLARHRTAMKQEQDRDQWRHVTSIVLAPLTLLAVIFYSERTASAPGKFRTRVCDALLLAGILRLLSSVLRTLTASYSSDTVYALAIAGMLVHVLACDYRYANGHVKKNAAFAGGVMSLNASLFSTTLLASRLSSNTTVYVFVCTSVILFAFYPAARHTIAVTQPHASYAITLVLSFTTWFLLETLQEKSVFGGTLLSICVVAPCWEYAVLQRHKMLLSGPWDIAHIVQEEGQ